MPALGGAQTRAFAKGEVQLGVQAASNPELLSEASPTQRLNLEIGTSGFERGSSLLQPDYGIRPA